MTGARPHPRSTWIRLLIAIEGPWYISTSQTAAIPSERAMERRLAAIVATDIVGYSRLMGEDEPGTLSAVVHLRNAVIDPESRSQRLSKSTGVGGASRPANYPI